MYIFSRIKVVLEITHTHPHICSYIVMDVISVVLGF